MNTSIGKHNICTYSYAYDTVIVLSVDISLIWFKNKMFRIIRYSGLLMLSWQQNLWVFNGFINKLKRWEGETGLKVQVKDGEWGA